MSKKKRKNTAVSKHVSKQRTPITVEMMQDITSAYVLFMLWIYPLYFENKYFNMGEAKWHFFKWITLIYFFLMVIVFICFQTGLFRQKRLFDFWINEKFSLTDKFVFSYAIICLISFILSPFKERTLWGMNGWYMGLISQLLFCFIYYFMSRYLKWGKNLFIGSLAVSFIVFLLGILNRFMIDPLGMYEKIHPDSIIEFLSTLGQATWFSSYLVILMPLGMFIFWDTEDRKLRIASGIYTAVSSMALIAQNSDSAIVAAFAIFLVLFSVSFEENVRMKRFLETVLVTIGSFVFWGLLQRIFKNRAVELSGLMTFLSQSLIMWLLLAAAVLIYLTFCHFEKKSFKINEHKKIRSIIWILLGVGLLLTVVYIFLNSVGLLDNTSFYSDNNYLRFNYMWGNQRGFSWIYSVATFVESDFLRKMIGSGPDGFCSIVYSYFAEDMQSTWGKSTILTNAHNEWLTSLINVGIVGFVAYLGIFISAVRGFVKRSKENRWLIAAVMAIAGYMAHNFFCYQQIICTPIIFMIIGAGEMLRRND